MVDVTKISDDEEKVCYTLPTNKDTKVFGPEYWEAFHDLAGRIPCSDCKTHAESFMRYWHDKVNERLGKPIFDVKNYRYWENNISKEAKRKNNILIGAIVIISVIAIVSILTKK